MTTLPNYTPFYGGGQVANPANVIPTSGAPNSTVLSENRLGTFAVDNSAQAIYYLASKSGGVDTWLLLEASGAAGSFTTLTNTLAYTLGTAQAANNSTIGSGQTTGTLIVGGSTATGTITVGSSSGVQNVAIAAGAGAAAVTIGNAQTAGSISLGAGMTTGTINIGGTGVSTGTVTIAGGTGAQTVNIANTAGSKTVVLGSTSTTSTTTIQAGTGGLALSAGGAVSVPPVTGSAAANSITLNGRVFQATLSGQTTASGSTLVCTVTNSAIIASSSAVQISVDNGGVNDAQMTVQRILLASGSVAITLKNNGAAALNGDIHINGWVLS